MRYVVLLMAALLAGGCATKAPEVKPTKNGRYAVTAETTSHASNGQAVARREAMKIAAKFCAKQERAENSETFDDRTTATSYVSTLVFTCR